MSRTVAARYRTACKQVDAWNAVVEVGDQVRRWGMMHPRRGPSSVERTAGEAFVAYNGLPLVQLVGVFGPHHLDCLAHPKTARERPILFKDVMVRAVLGLDVEEPKTVTRRVGDAWKHVEPGDRLWVRECWGLGPTGLPVYRSDHRADERPKTWKPSLFMPRAQTRIWLRVVSVAWESDRAVRGIDDAEARREGFRDAAAFRALWQELHPTDTGRVRRIEFEREPPGDV